MKTILALSLMALATSAFSSTVEIDYARTADITTSSSNVVVAYAQYVMLPTETEVRDIPNCNIYDEGTISCTEVVVLKREPAIQATVTYSDALASSEDNGGYLTFNFKLSDFSADQVALLKAATPAWKHPFSSAGFKFAKNNLVLTATKAQRDIQVLDMKKSKLCEIGENGEQVDPRCKEVLVYKAAVTTVKEVNVSVK